MKILSTSVASRRLRTGGVVVTARGESAPTVLCATRRSCPYNSPDLEQDADAQQVDVGASSKGLLYSRTSTTSTTMAPCSDGGASAAASSSYGKKTRRGPAAVMRSARSGGKVCSPRRSSTRATTRVERLSHDLHVGALLQHAQELQPSRKTSSATTASSRRPGGKVSFPIGAKRMITSRRSLFLFHIFATAGAAVARSVKVLTGTTSKMFLMSSLSSPWSSSTVQPVGASSPSEPEQELQPWLTYFETSDPDCWSKNKLIDWELYRRQIFEAIKDVHDLRLLRLPSDFQKNWIFVLKNFAVALQECPLGTIASSTLAAAWQQNR